jgi:hypothetical protein
MIQYMGIKLKATLAIGLLLFGLACCKKENDKGYMSGGVITGPDMRMCASPCCGGWYIEIDNQIFEFDAIPSNSDIDLQNATFPIFVKVQWTLLDTPTCPQSRISIQRMVRYYPQD